MELSTEARTVEVPGARLHLTDVGDGPPLLLLHGWPQSSVMWRPVLDRLARDHRVLAPDLRGMGRSEAPPGAYAKHDLAADVLALLDAEGIGRAAVVGHDWGGWIAWLLALEHPDRVERFAALDIPPPWPDASPLRLPAKIVFGSYQVALASPLAGRRVAGSERFIRAMFAAGAGERGPAGRDLVDEYVAQACRPANARASVALYRTFLTRELPAIARGDYTVAELTVPGLTMMGGRSPILKMAGLPDEGPFMRVREIPGAGHFLVDECPDVVLGHLLPFLAGEDA